MTEMNDDRLSDGVIGIWKSKGREAVLKTTGLSMIPTIEDGDEIVLKQASVSEIKRGDLVTFKVGPTVVTHRVIKRIDRDGEVQFLQKGDHGPKLFPLPGSCVIGKVVEIRTPHRVIPLTGWFARIIAYGVAILESVLAGPIKAFSERLKLKTCAHKRLNLFLVRFFLRLRSRSMGLILRAFRLLCGRKR